MDLDLQLQHTELINKEKDKLSSTNKIHNFTTASLPSETISLLNKGTNYIPTTSTSSTSSIAHTVLSEVNTTLCSIIDKKNYQSQIKPSTSRRTSHCLKLYFSHSTPLTLLQQEQSRPNLNSHLIDYVHNTVSYTKEILQSHDLRSPSCITKFTIRYTKNHTTNTCIHIFHPINHNKFSLVSLKLRQYHTVDFQRLQTTTTL